MLGTSLGPDQATAPQVLRHYRHLLQVEHRFRVLKDFLRLRPVRHFTETRVRGHVAVCVYAAVIEALIAADLRRAGLRDPDLVDQHLTPVRALRELGRVHAITIHAGERTVQVITRRSPLQAQILAALGVDTTSWAKATLS
ncbi:MAG: hypothetical protein JJLCMIEE_01791 [Acidimicrobiales bacterium]|nr:hypothetical protein [Acidimicrobiales bacterium]